MKAPLTRGHKYKYNNYPRAQIQKYNNYLGAHFALVLAHGSLRVLSMLWVEICTYLKNAVCGDVYFKKILWVEIYIRKCYRWSISNISSMNITDMKPEVYSATHIFDSIRFWTL